MASISIDSFKDRLTVLRPEEPTDDGNPQQWVPVCRGIWCNCSSNVGYDVDSGRQVTAREKATVTIRRRSGVTANCRVLRGSDPVPYEIVGPVLDPDGERRWLQFKVERGVAAV